MPRKFIFLCSIFVLSLNFQNCYAPEETSVDASEPKKPLESQLKSHASEELSDGTTSTTTSTLPATSATGGPGTAPSRGRRLSAAAAGSGYGSKVALPGTAVSAQHAMEQATDALRISSAPSTTTDADLNRPVIGGALADGGGTVFLTSTNLPGAVQRTVDGESDRSSDGRPTPAASPQSSPRVVAAGQGVGPDGGGPGYIPPQTSSARISSASASSAPAAAPRPGPVKRTAGPLTAARVASKATAASANATAGSDAVAPAPAAASVARPTPSDDDLSPAAAIARLAAGAQQDADVVARLRAMQAAAKEPLVVDADMWALPSTRPGRTGNPLDAGAARASSRERDQSLLAGAAAARSAQEAATLQEYTNDPVAAGVALVDDLRAAPDSREAKAYAEESAEWTAENMAKFAAAQKAAAAAAAAAAAQAETDAQQIEFNRVVATGNLTDMEAFLAASGGATSGQKRAPLPHKGQLPEAAAGPGSEIWARHFGDAEAAGPSPSARGERSGAGAASPSAAGGLLPTVGSGRASAVAQGGASATSPGARSRAGGGGTGGRSGDLPPYVPQARSQELGRTPGQSGASAARAAASKPDFVSMDPAARAVKKDRSTTAKPAAGGNDGAGDGGGGHAARNKGPGRL